MKYTSNHVSNLNLHVYLKLLSLYRRRSVTMSFAIILNLRYCMFSHTLFLKIFFTMHYTSSLSGNLSFSSSFLAVPSLSLLLMSSVEQIAPCLNAAISIVSESHLKILAHRATQFLTSATA